MARHVGRTGFSWEARFCPRNLGQTQIQLVLMLFQCKFQSLSVLFMSRYPTRKRYWVGGGGGGGGSIAAFLFLSFNIDWGLKFCLQC